MSTALRPQVGKSMPAPPEAFRWESPVLFVADSSTEDEHRVQVQARTPGVVNHWYWGRMIHDMAGCQFKDRLPLDWRHNPDEIIGYVDTVQAGDQGLQVSALLQSLRDGDKASDVIKRGRKGTPYEASIYWDENNNVLEYLDEGFTTQVNGQQVEGPLVIARQWTLRGIALTPYGVDSSTNTQFSAGRSADAIPVTLNPAKDAMSKTPTTAAEPIKDSAADTNVQTSTAQTPAAATQDAGRGELARYMDRFGAARGAEYFRDSVTYEQACEREIDHLRKELATRDSELAAERAKLKSTAASLGEPGPVDTGSQNKDSEPAKKTWGSMFKKAGS